MRIASCRGAAVKAVGSNNDAGWTKLNANVISGSADNEMNCLARSSLNDVEHHEPTCVEGLHE